MKLFQSARWLLVALVLSLIPASSHAGVFISVGFAPPALPVYEQPPCPEPGLMWTPGYWAYGPDGYYWVPGAWVPAPYEGALWTPGYWGFSTGLYVWHPGYWGPHVGYYGGVNYGFGYMGVGFVGGRWHGRDFVYNTAVMHVNERVVHTTYVDRTVIVHNTIVNDRRVAYSGGPGGIRHEPLPEERMAEHDRHMERTAYQTEHVEAARNDHNAYYRNNNGHPPSPAFDHQRPESHPEPVKNSHFDQPANQNHPQQAQYQRHDNHPQPQPYQPHENHPNNQGGGHFEMRPSAPQQHPQGHPDQPHPQHESHGNGKNR
jgi:hypothetical protein